MIGYVDLQRLGTGADFPRGVFTTLDITRSDENGDAVRGKFLSDLKPDALVSAREETPVVIIGAGLTGLTLATFLLTAARATAQPILPAMRVDRWARGLVRRAHLERDPAAHRRRFN